MSKSSSPYPENLNPTPPLYLQNPSKMTTPSSINPQKPMNKSMMMINSLPKTAETHEFLDSTTVTHSSLVTEPIRQSSQDMKCVIQHLVLENFKLKACPFNIQHNHKSCPFYHNTKDKKRPGTFYTADICEYAEREENCPNGDLCQKSHNRVEQLYRADKYKTKFCSFYPNYLEKCEYGIFCSFAHNENDILVELIHNLVYDDDFFMFKYKTIWCPFNLTQHDKSLCVYAHNWQDYRRSPHLYHYEPNPCPNWKSNDFVINYNEGCGNNFACTKCHGWKEHEFHPLNYKIKLCPAGKNCTKGRDCSYYHNEIDRRVLSQEIAYNVFKYFPKNRIITNTYKTLINEQTISNIGNEYSSEIVLTNVNNPWEKRDSASNFQNVHIHSLTDANLLNLYDNVERRESNNSADQEQTKLKPSFSMNSLDKYNNIQTTTSKFTNKADDPKPNRPEIIYPNETWTQKKVISPPSKYMMAFSQPLSQPIPNELNNNKPDIYPNQFMSFEDNDAQMISQAALNRSYNQTPSINPNTMKNPSNMSMSLNFGINPPPNLKKINPMPQNPTNNMMSKPSIIQKQPQLNNTPNTMNAINQMRTSNSSLRINQQQQQPPMNFNSKSANTMLFDQQSQPVQNIQMSYPSNKPTTTQKPSPKQSFLPQNPQFINQGPQIITNNTQNMTINQNLNYYEKNEQNDQKTLKLSMNSINQFKDNKPQFNLNINSQPFTVSYSFNYTQNQGNLPNLQKTRSETETFDKKMCSKIGFWTNNESNSVHKINSQVNLKKESESYEFDYDEKQIRSENTSPNYEKKEEDLHHNNTQQEKLDKEFENKLTIERENDKHSEAQINSMLKNICEEEYEDKL